MLNMLILSMAQDCNISNTFNNGDAADFQETIDIVIRTVYAMWWLP